MILVFKDDLLKMLQSLVAAPSVRKSDPELDRSFTWNINIVVATLPAVVVGLLLKHSIDRIFDNLLVTYAILAVTGIIMLLTKLLDDRGAVINWPCSLALGVAQAMAIMPGLYQSGSTIFAGMLPGDKRETAAS